MLKFIKHHMETIDGIELFPLISFFIFFIFFLGLFWHVLSMKKHHVEAMSSIPLNEEAVEPRQINRHETNN